MYWLKLIVFLMMCWQSAHGLTIMLSSREMIDGEPIDRGFGLFNFLWGLLVAVAVIADK